MILQFNVGSVMHGAAKEEDGKAAGAARGGQGRPRGEGDREDREGRQEWKVWKMQH